VFGPGLAALTQQLGPAIVRPSIAPVVEEYTICRLTRLADAAGRAVAPGSLDDRAIVELLLGEPRPLTEDARRNLLSRRFSYTEQDLAVLSWDAALVVTRRGRPGRRVPARIRQRTTARAPGV
jgi:hypothetical protein